MRSPVDRHLPAYRTAIEFIRSMTRAIPLLISLASAGWAGDYWLTVANDPDARCAGRAKETSPSWPVVSAMEVAQDVVRYFAGQETRIALFRAAFGNGRVTFCGARERSQVYEALIEVATKGARANASHLNDFAMMLGSRQLLDMIDTRVRDNSVPELAAKRLHRMRAAVVKGIKLRQERAS